MKNIAQASRCVALMAASLLPALAEAQLVPLPNVAGVPFHPNVFGQAATEAAAGAAGGEAAAPKPVPGMPQDIYLGHASVVMWADASGETRYSAAVALHSVVFTMSLGKCRKQNGGSDANCQEVFDGPAAALAVVKASDGGYFFVTGKNKSAAKKKGLEACAQRANVTCKIDKTYGEGGGFFD